MCLLFSEFSVVTVLLFFSNNQQRDGSLKLKMSCVFDKSIVTQCMFSLCPTSLAFISEKQMMLIIENNCT